MGRRIGRWIVGLGAIASAVGVLAVGIAGQGVPPGLVGIKEESGGVPDRTLEGYEYGVRGNAIYSAAVVSGLAVGDDGKGGQEARITVWKGPCYGDYDPDVNGYPGCTLLDALAAGFFEDMDSAQVVVCWRDREGRMFTADNLTEGPTLGRARAARWEWREAGRDDGVWTKVALGKEAMEMTVLMVYTDVLWGYTDMFTPPEDGPAIMGSWDGVKVEGGDGVDGRGGEWRITRRDEVGVGALPGTDEIARWEAAEGVRKIIEERTGGRYTLVTRNNIGQPVESGHVNGYDSGFEVVRKKAEDAGGKGGE